MLSFLSKFLGRKKEDKSCKDTSTLLDGKSEQNSPPLISSAPAVFHDLANGKVNNKDTSFSTVFRTKSLQAVSDSSSKKSELPLLSLPFNLHEPYNDDLAVRALGVAFGEDPESHVSLADDVVGQRRLSPSETLSLVRACSEAINVRGLETLGVMHPHWHSASPDIQRKLILLFLHSLTPTTLPFSSSLSPFAAFESEISVARSPHDVAAVLRWGLRHLKLEGSSFGIAPDWYESFSSAEKSSGYSPTAFSDALVPRVNASHLSLLTAVLDIFSSLGAHAEANGTSGSKLSKVFGLWLLTTQRVAVHDDWLAFYTHWERLGRILEHLFLARVREQNISQRMPVRLLELVRQYPYTTSTSSDDEGDLLHRPRFSTRRYPALLVRIETEPATMSQSKLDSHLSLVYEVFRTPMSNLIDLEPANLWVQIKEAFANESIVSPGDFPDLGRVFADETIRFLKLLPRGTDTVPGCSPRSLKICLGGRKSFSLYDQDNSCPSNQLSSKSTAETISPPSAVDWSQFSTSGFSSNASAIPPLTSTLLDQEVEVSQPSLRKVGKRVKQTYVTSPGRKSLDLPRRNESVSAGQPVNDVVALPAAKNSNITSIKLTQVDEAFIDFWGDALLDPIAADWPPFVICKLKLPLGAAAEWLIVERVYSASPQSPTHVPDGVPVSYAQLALSPQPSYLRESRKRFSFFSKHNNEGNSTTSIKRLSSLSSVGRKKKGIKIGEMGEVVQDEDQRDQKVYPTKIVTPDEVPETEVVLNTVEESFEEVPSKSQVVNATSLGWVGTGTKAAVSNTAAGATVAVANFIASRGSSSKAAKDVAKIEAVENVALSEYTSAKAPIEDAAEEDFISGSPETCLEQAEAGRANVSIIVDESVDDRPHPIAQGMHRGDSRHLAPLTIKVAPSSKDQSPLRDSDFATTFELIPPTPYSDSFHSNDGELGIKGLVNSEQKGSAFASMGGEFYRDLGSSTSGVERLSDASPLTEYEDIKGSITITSEGRFMEELNATEQLAEASANGDVLLNSEVTGTSPINTPIARELFIFDAVAEHRQATLPEGGSSNVIDFEPVESMTEETVTTVLGDELLVSQHVDRGVASSAAKGEDASFAVIITTLEGELEVPAVKESRSKPVVQQSVVEEAVPTAAADATIEVGSLVDVDVADQGISVVEGLAFAETLPTTEQEITEEAPTPAMVAKEPSLMESFSEVTSAAPSAMVHDVAVEEDSDSTIETTLQVDDAALSRAAIMLVSKDDTIAVAEDKPFTSKSNSAAPLKEEVTTECDTPVEETVEDLALKEVTATENAAGEEEEYPRDENLVVENAESVHAEMFVVENVAPVIEQTLTVHSVKEEPVSSVLFPEGIELPPDEYSSSEETTHFVVGEPSSLEPIISQEEEVATSVVEDVLYTPTPSEKDIVGLVQELELELVREPIVLEPVAVNTQLGSSKIEETVPEALPTVNEVAAGDTSEDVEEQMFQEMRETVDTLKSVDVPVASNDAALEEPTVPMEGRPTKVELDAKNAASQPSAVNAVSKHIASSSSTYPDYP